MFANDGRDLGAELLVDSTPIVSQTFARFFVVVAILLEVYHLANVGE
jgi:hypothetical protein